MNLIFKAVGRTVNNTINGTCELLRWGVFVKFTEE